MSGSDRDLLVAWGGGDTGAGKAFYRRHAERIAEFVNRKIDGEASDLVQRAFLGCLEAVRAGRVVDNPRAFLYRVARHEIYDYWRARRRDQERFDPHVSSLRDMATSPTSHVARDQRQRRVLAVIEALPLEAQLALELYYWEGLSMREVAEALGVSRTAALSRVHRARAQVRAQLDAVDPPAFARPPEDG